MPKTYDPIATQTLGSAAASVTFSSISQAYTDLVLIFQGSTIANARVDIRVGNGSLDTGTNYSNTEILGTTTAQSIRLSNTNTMQGMFDAVGTATDQVNSITNFLNYSNTTTNKTVLGRSNAPQGVSAYVGLWRSSVAINIISLIPTSNFATGSTFTLYGIKAA